MNIKVVSSLFALCLFAIYSCNEQTTSQVSKPSDADYDNIGVNHNRCLDNILSSINLVKTKSQTFPEKDQVKDIVDSITLEYITQEYNLDMATANKVLFHINKTKGIGNPEREDFIGKDNLYPFYQRLSTIMDDEDENLESLQSRILRLTLEAEVKLSENEKNEFLPACSVARNTLNYWHDNASEWYVISGQSTQGRTFSWKRLGKEDVKGAIATATGEAVSALVFGPIGWKAYFAACVGGAAISSAYDAIEQLWP